MTRNPYAQMGNINDPGRPAGYGGPGDFINDRPPRTSALAVASLIVSIVSLVVCCIPGPGVLGMLLAFAAVISITTSGGRRTGMGMAIAGLVLGLVATVIMVVIFLTISGGLSVLSGYSSNLLQAVWQRDASATAAAFDPGVSAAISPERLDAFVQEVESEMGAFKDTPTGLGPFWRDYQRLDWGVPALTAITNQGHSGNIFPLPAEFDNGLAMVVIELVPGGSVAGNTMPPLRNLAVVLPSGRVVWLLDPKLPAAQPAPAIPPAPTTTPDPALPPPTVNGERQDPPTDDAPAPPMESPSDPPSAEPQDPTPLEDPGAGG